MNFRIALAQIDAKVGDLRANIEHHLAFMERARKKGAKLAVFPELSLTGYSLKDLAWDIAQPVGQPNFLKELRKPSRKISVVVGFVESAPNHGIYNSAAFLEDGEVKWVHRKVYPPTYGMFEEGRYFGAGTEVRAFDSKWGRFGMLICEDLWHMSLPYTLALDGAELILCPTASPTRIAGASPDLAAMSVNHEHHRTYARLLGSYMAFANRVGFEDGVNFWGGSALTAPDGTMTAKGAVMEEDLVIGEVKSAEVERARRFSRHFLDERPEIVVRALRRILRSGPVS